MKRTTIYLEADQGILLKLESRRQGRAMADLVRQAVTAYLSRGRGAPPPGAGAFASGTTETAGRTEELLADTAFGE